MLNEATKKNLRRKSAWVDKVQLHDGVPLWSLLEINPTELCSRACSFCPRSDPAAYPNQPLHMSIDLAHRIALELKSLAYDGGVSFCGYGEPLLHPRFTDLVRQFADFRCEVVTSGDGLTVDRIKRLADAGMNYFVVSLYDGPEQVAKFKDMFATAGFDGYILRDRWHNGADDFGLKLTNRAGAVSVGNQDPVMPERPCHYLAYELLLDWNGDVLLCPQDWDKKLKFGNATATSLFDIWTSKAMSKRRKQLFKCRENLIPCKGCNVSGDLHGFNHVEAWSQ